MIENVKPETVRESLANYAHEAWAGWMKYLFGKSIDLSSGAVVIPGKLVKRWKRQIATPYAELPESEKESDRAEADKILECLPASHLADAVRLMEEVIRDRENEGAYEGGCRCDVCNEWRAILSRLHEFITKNKESQ